MLRTPAILAPLLLQALAAGQDPAIDPAVDPALYGALAWRNIGPFRGGRSTAATGIPESPHTYYFGACGGGLWRTDNAGTTWRNVSDGFFATGTVGAIAVAPSDANVVYAGMGESPVRAVTTTHGNGVYKSTDAGKTWTHVGLTDSRHIGAVRVHPQDPDTVWVAAQGNPWGPSATRGVYKTTNGGESWNRVLFVNEDTGATDLSLDATNPRILYASMWDHRRRPWQIRSGGPGSGLYKSTDGGRSWKAMTAGLPRGMGKAGISVSAADPQRVWAIIESDEGGLYRSDNGGKTWRLMNAERVLRARSWYYMHVFADPTDADTVYVLNAPMMKSIDGGRTFTRIRTPHGDNHDLWINPRHPLCMINANDGGANVSLDGGKTWSTQNNQPTAQFYRVNTDNQFPFWVYGGQQDNSTVAIKSRTFDRGIGAGDWYSVGGGESAHISFDANDPRLVYATTILGMITEFDRVLGHSRSIQAYPQFALGADARDYRYRFNWNPPVHVSMHDARVLYHAAHVLLKSTDRGKSWRAISPDLTRNEDAKQGKGGVPYTNEAASAEIYNTIFYLAESTHDARELWAGSDCGLVHVTRDGGGSWTNVTPKDLGETQINAIDLSQHARGKAWLAVTGYKLNDFTPQVFRTTDGGKTWRKLVRGLPADTFVRVVREDPVRAGLVYAGTEAGMFVSFDDGARWQSLQLNLPRVPITDLQVRGRSLVASTQGRAFWILDEVGPLREVDAAVAKAEHHLFQPGDAIRTIRRGGFTAKPGKNPPAGAVIRTCFRSAPDSKKQRVAIEILDAEKRVVRTWSNRKTDRTNAYRDTVESYARERAKPYGLLRLKKGMNELVWDLRRENVTVVAGHLVPSGWRGPRVAPGAYWVRLRVGDSVQEAALRVTDDPRRKLPQEAFDEQQAVLRALYGTVNTLHASITRMRSLRSQLRGILERTRGHAKAGEIAKACEALIARVTAWDESVIQSDRETQQDVANFENKLSMQLLALLGEVDSSDPPVTAGAGKRFADLREEWRRAQRAMEVIRRDGLTRLNERLAAWGVQAVHVPR